MISQNFWLWFWRPIAETLGALALISIVAIIFIVTAMALEWFARRKRTQRKD